VYAGAEPTLRRWQERLQDPLGWVACMSEHLDRFFGLEDTYALTVHLLPSAPGWDGGTGGMLFGPGTATLECSGKPPERGEDVLPALLHEAAHAIHQPRVLDPLWERVRPTPLGERAVQQWARTPLPALHVDVTSYVGELVIHSLVPNGALLPACGLPPADAYWRRVRARGASVRGSARALERR
jgi:hypothetical protein